VAKSFISRRVSEFVGVALFALALIWFISLASYSPSDPVWFFNTGSRLPPVNFAGRIGAFVAELSYQLLGYSTYLTPIMLVVVGWHYFWCRSLDAAYTKLVGAALLFGCVSSFMSLAFGTWEISGKTFRAGGILGDRLAALLAAYLNRTGSIILILTLLFLGIILSTQFSLGRLFAAIGQLLKDRIAATFAAYRAWRDDRRREKQRQEVLKKHLDKTAKAGEPGARPKIAVPRTAELAGRAPADAESPATARSTEETIPYGGDGRGSRCRAQGRIVSSNPTRHDPAASRGGTSAAIAGAREAAGGAEERGLHPATAGAARCSQERTKDR